MRDGISEQAGAAHIDQRSERAGAGSDEYRPQKRLRIGEILKEF